VSSPFAALLLDLDGTVYRGSQAVPGAAAFLRRAAALGVEVLFLTNRSTRTPEAVAGHLQRLGIPARPEAVLTSALATVHLLEREAPGARVFFVGEEGLERALASSSLEMTDRDPDYVVVGFDRSFDYAKLAAASHWVREGAQLIATNPDRVLNTDDGLAPGNGALVAAVATAANAEAQVVGKPARPIFDAALRRLQAPPGAVLVVGDNLETDIAGGVQAGLATALLLTGVSTRADVERLPEGAARPHHIVEDFAALETLALGEGE
jgi:4-nitrophenyl phosphatase